MTSKEISIKINQALDLLEQADALVQESLGACDECEEIHNRIEDLSEDIIGLLVFVDSEVV